MAVLEKNFDESDERGMKVVAVKGVVAKLTMPTVKVKG